MKKIGLFGGTFDPVHFGHIKGALKIKKLFSLDEIIFIPCADPPHKNIKKISDITHRLDMLKLAIKNYPFSISDIEIEREGKSYTIDTILYFKEKFGSNAELFFLIGADAFLDIHTWKMPKNLLENASFIIMARALKGADFLNMKENTLKYLKDKFPDSSIFSENYSNVTRTHPAIFLADIPLIDISSTEIRKFVKDKKSINHMTSEKVIEYIKKKELYL